MQAHLQVFCKQCHTSVTDYLGLVRTRLLNLEPVPNNDNSSEALELVTKSINEFRSTGHLPLQLIKTSIFLSPYFVGCVLPLLLSPTRDDSDVPEALVEELNRSELVSQSLTLLRLAQCCLVCIEDIIMTCSVLPCVYRRHYYDMLSVALCV